MCLQMAENASVKQIKVIILMFDNKVQDYFT